MTRTYRQSQADLEKTLERSVHSIELSARSFDEGYVGEAARLAVAIRVLVHDSKNAKSLLGQLGKKTMPFCDTASEVLPENRLTHNGITAILQTEKGAKYCALLDMLPDERLGRYVDFDKWWAKVIFLDSSGREMTRESLILNVADTDGGAHVDPKLDDTYAALSRENSLAWKWSSPTGRLPLREPHLAAVRQIAHEVLRSLKPSMPAVEPAMPPGAVLSLGGSLTATPVARRSPMAKVGRNALCPCGSGKKYKRCCLRVVD